MCRISRVCRCTHSFRHAQLQARHYLRHPCPLTQADNMVGYRAIKESQTAVCRVCHIWSLHQGNRGNHKDTLPTLSCRKKRSHYSHVFRTPNHRVYQRARNAGHTSCCAFEYAAAHDEANSLLSRDSYMRQYLCCTLFNQAMFQDGIPVWIPCTYCLIKLHPSYQDNVHIDLQNPYKS